MFINHNYINNKLQTNSSDYDKVKAIIAKSQNKQVLTHDEVCVLLNTDDEKSLQLIYDEATRIKSSLYGNRVVLFAPLYVSDFCTNNCTYCGYRRDNVFDRKKLSFNEVKEEVALLNKLGHKRLALEVGEDEVNYPIEDVLACIDAIYEGSDIRRVNVNIAATTVENYRKLKSKEIGTYILFQETYHQDSYENYHPKSLKGNYERQLYAHHNAMDAGIDDVGGGVLFGLYDYKYEVMGLVLHNEELEKTHGVGFHTISVPRLKKAAGMNVSDYQYLVSDSEFKKLVSILRIVVPYTGIILSTRETVETRQMLIDLGVTQISAGSQTGVGGYKENETSTSTSQFEVSDERSPLEVIKDLVSRGYLPSYCTACYRVGRTGMDFMDIVKAGKIGAICHPNALLTFVEYIEDYGDDELKDIGYKFVDAEVLKIENQVLKAKVLESIAAIKSGKRDIYV